MEQLISVMVLKGMETVINQRVIGNGRGNSDCLNLIRLLAAFQVLYGHTLAHMNIDSIPILGEFINFFSGVPIFFTMSGFLIWGSIGRSKNFGEYLKKRFWRIFPELWGAVAIELIVLLCLYHEPINWLQFGAFAITQSTIFQFWTPEFLRGYGCGCPNGALWTICVLIQFYFFAYFVYKALHGRKTWVWLIAIVASLGLSLMLPFIREYLPEIARKLLGQTLLPYFWMFLAASFVAEKKDVVLPFLKKYWWVFLAALLLVRISGFDFMAGYNVLSTILLFLCLTGAAYVFPKLNVKTDISYGVYIYHMTVVNALIALGYTGNQWLLLLVTAITFILAWISTKTIGKLSMRMKRKSQGSIRQRVEE